jgi:hypothetical protein
MSWPDLQPRWPLVACGVSICLTLALVLSADSTRDALPPASPKFDPHPDAVFVDDFKSSDLKKWRADRSGVWKVRHGVLVADLPDAKQQHSALYGGDEEWTDYAVDLDVCGMRGVDKGVVVRVKDARGIGVDLRGPGYQDLKVYLNESAITRVDVDNANGQWHHIRVEIRGSRCRILVDGTELVNKRMPSRIPMSGGIALISYTGGVGECTVYYDNIAVTPLDATAREQ